jgi:hypothetical protein
MGEYASHARRATAGEDVRISALYIRARTAPREVADDLAAAKAELGGWTAVATRFGVSVEGLRRIRKMVGMTIHPGGI